LELPSRVHAELGQDGEITIAAVRLPKRPDGPVRVMLSSQCTYSNNPLLFHKTTERAMYTQALEQAQRQGFYETLFTNERGHLTEGSFTNLFVRLDGQWLTPPVSDGMLPGIWRQSFIKDTDARERVITLSDLQKAEQIIIGNSVRGAISVGQVSDKDSRTVLWNQTE
jgi:para-aminobenzoate synthetase/4-amino-4-deoxychorismate lyase